MTEIEWRCCGAGRVQEADACKRIALVGMVSTILLYFLLPTPVSASPSVGVLDMTAAEYPTVWTFDGVEHPVKFTGWEVNGDLAVTLFPSSPIGDIRQIVVWYRHYYDDEPLPQPDVRAVSCNRIIGAAAGPVQLRLHLTCAENLERSACPLPRLPRNGFFGAPHLSVDCHSLYPRF